MTSELKRRANNNYYCSNCMMMQPIPLPMNCVFCGNWFSNYELIMIKNFKDLEREDQKENESNICRGTGE